MKITTWAIIPPKLSLHLGSHLSGPVGCALKQTWKILLVSPMLHHVHKTHDFHDHTHILYHLFRFPPSLEQKLRGCNSLPCLQPSHSNFRWRKQGHPWKIQGIPRWYSGEKKRGREERRIFLFFIFVERYEGSEFSVKQRRIKVTGKCIKRRPKMHGRTWKIYKWKKDREKRLACWDKVETWNNEILYYRLFLRLFFLLFAFSPLAKVKV